MNARSIFYNTKDKTVLLSTGVECGKKRNKKYSYEIENNTLNDDELELDTLAMVHLRKKEKESPKKR